MDLLLSSVFVAGIYFWILPRLRGKYNTFEFKMSIFFPLGLVGAGAILGLIGGNFDPVQALTYFGFISSLCFAVFFQKELLPKITEHIVLINTLVFWYLLIEVIGWNSILFIPIISIFSVGVLINALLPKSPHAFFKISFYVWQLIMLSTIAGIHIMKVLMMLDTPVMPGIFDVFIAGMLYVYIFTHVLPIFMLIPGKKNRIKDIKRHVKFLLTKYDERQLTFKGFAFIIITAAVLLIGNHYLELVPHLTMVDVAVLSTPTVLKLFRT